METENETFVVMPDPAKLCRLCANTHDQLIPIFKEGIDLNISNISNKIEKHLPIVKISEEDKLPLQICYQCASTLIAWHNFYEGCGIADTRLRKILCVDEKISQDDSFDDCLDELQVDYDDEESQNNLIENVRLTSASSSSQADDVRHVDNTAVNELSETKIYEETENDNHSDERCLRWTYETVKNIDDRCANMPGTRGGAISSSNIKRDNLVDEFLVKRKDSLVVKEKQSPSDICDCVWSIGSCSKCSIYDNFKCNFCPMVFLKPEVRNKHLRTSHTHQLLNYCMDWMFKNSAKLKDEDQDKMNDIDVLDLSSQYQCDSCYAIFDDKVHLLEHLRIHTKKIDSDVHNSDLTSGLKPNNCLDISESNSHLMENVRFRNKFQCDHCLRLFCTKVELIKHFFDFHAEIFYNTSQINSRDSFHVETRLSKDVKNKIANESFKNFNVKSEANKDENSCKSGYYSCKVCEQIFLKKHSFTRHVNLHSSNRYDCDKCKKTFSSEHVLNTHQSRKHKELPKNVFFLNGRKYLKCDQCSFTCRNERNKLEEHMRVHTGEKPFTCELCGKQFRTKALLRVHRRFVHEGIKEHACDICGRCFSNKRYTEEHRRIHTGEKPLICDLCGKTFRQSSALSKHVQNHMGIKRHVCHLCGKRFSNSHHLRIHIKRHMGEANYVCTYCGKGFVDQYQLKNHNVVHSEERPFVCGLCGTGFKLLKHLKQHGKTHRSA